MSLECAPTNDTIVKFVITKSVNVGSLIPLVIMDAEKVVQILSAQIRRLERMLGGVEITAVDVAVFKVKSKGPETQEEQNKKDNRALLILLGVVAIFFVTVYTIAIYKVCK